MLHPGAPISCLQRLLCHPACHEERKHADNVLLITSPLFVIGFLRWTYSFLTHNLKPPHHRSSHKSMVLLTSVLQVITEVISMCDKNSPVEQSWTEECVSASSSCIQQYPSKKVGWGVRGLRGESRGKLSTVWLTSEGESDESINMLLKGASIWFVVAGQSLRGILVRVTGTEGFKFG